MSTTIQERLEHLIEDFSDEEGLNNKLIAAELEGICDAMNKTEWHTDNQRDNLRAYNKTLLTKIEEYKALASMSDARFSDELDTQIEYCRRADEGGETYGASCDIHILKIARDRLRR